MYLMVRKYSGKGGLLGCLAPQISDGLVPILRRSPGFSFHGVFASEDSHILSVSIFEGQQTAYVASEAVRQWVAANLRHALPDPPETLAGHVLRDVSPEREGRDAERMYLAIRQWEGVRSPDRLIAVADEHVLPVLQQASGLLRHCVLTSAQHPQRVTAVSLVDSRENALRLSGLVADIVRDKARDIAPNPPRVILARAFVTAAA